MKGVKDVSSGGIRNVWSRQSVGGVDDQLLGTDVNLFQIQT